MCMATSTITCTAAQRVWHFSAFQSRIRYQVVLLCKYTTNLHYTILCFFLVAARMYKLHSFSTSTHRLYYSPAVCTPLSYHCCPTHHHTLYPTPPCSRTPHGHSLVMYHQPVELFHQRILKTHKNRTVL